MVFPGLDRRAGSRERWGMLYLGTTVLAVVLVTVLLALARILTNWFADR